LVMTLGLISQTLGAPAPADGEQILSIPGPPSELIVLLG